MGNPIRYRDASATLSALLASAGLAEDSLEPWTTWKSFKAFIRTPLDDVVGDPLVQYGVYDDEDRNAAAAEFWTQDVTALADFVHRVESAEGFQALMNARPVATSLFREEA